MSAVRVHFGFLSRPEQIFIRHFVGRIPTSITPDHLTAFACVGAILAGVSLVLCRYSEFMLFPFYAGLLVHWLGDSFDGAVARYRRCERHRVGFLIDRSCDTFSFCTIILCLGLSPYLPILSALLLLVGYLVNSIYSLMSNVIKKKQFVGFGGIGATEGRIFIGIWVAAIALSRTDLMSAQVLNSSTFLLLSSAVFAVTLLLIAWRVLADIAHINATEEQSNTHADIDNIIQIKRAIANKQSGTYQKTLETSLSDNGVSATAAFSLHSAKHSIAANSRQNLKFEKPVI